VSCGWDFLNVKQDLTKIDVEGSGMWTQITLADRDEAGRVPAFPVRTSQNHPLCAVSDPVGAFIED